MLYIVNKIINDVGEQRNAACRLFYARTEQFSKSGEAKIKTLDYMIAISFMITHGSIDSAGL